MVAMANLCQCSSVCDLEQMQVADATLVEMQSAVQVLIDNLGEDSSREGLIDTPRRVAKAWLDMAATGHGGTVRGAFGNALFNEPLVAGSPDGLVLVRDITFAALSEETLLPFHGRCHVAYIPQAGVVLGLSKLARATRCLASRIQSQDQLAADLMAAVQQEVAPKGVAVVITAKHLGVSSSEPALRNSIAAVGCLADKKSGLLDEVLLMLRIKEESRDNHVGCSGTNGVDDGIRSDINAPSLPMHTNTTSKCCDASGSTSGSTTHMVSAVQTLLKGVGENIARPGLRDSASRYVRWLQDATAGYTMDAFACPTGSGGSLGCGNNTNNSTDITLGPSTPDAVSTEVSDASSDDMPLDPGACFVNLREWRGGAHTAGLEGEGEGEDGNDSADDDSGIQIVSLPFASQCEHHLLPFYGTLRIAYLPPPGGNHNTNENSGVAAAGGVDSVAIALAVKRLAHVVATYSKRLQVQERLTQQVADAAAAVLGVSSTEGTSAVLVVCDSAHMCMVARGVEEHASATMTTAARGAWAASPRARRVALQALLSRSS